MRGTADTTRINLTLPIIAGAFCFATLTYGFVLWFVLTSRVGVQAVGLNPLLRGAFFVVAGLALVGAVAWTRLRLTPAAEVGDGPPRSADDLVLFQRDAIIALGLAEAGAVVGFVSSFLAGTMQDYLYTAIPGLAVMLLVIVPPIVRFLNRP